MLGCTVITAWPEFTVRPEVGGQAESTGCVVFYVVAPTWSLYVDFKGQGDSLGSSY